MNASTLQNELKILPGRLKEYGHDFYNEGEAGFHIGFNKPAEPIVIAHPNPYHKEGTLIVHDNSVGFVSYIAAEK